VERPYRWLALLLGSRGDAIGLDLPGTDRPDLVALLLDDQKRWLEDSSESDG
jgi:hypothetical protein